MIMSMRLNSVIVIIEHKFPEVGCSHLLAEPASSPVPDWPPPVCAQRRCHLLRIFGRISGLSSDESNYSLTIPQTTILARLCTRSSSS
jgi:hypothetical protein